MKKVRLILMLFMVPIFGYPQGGQISGTVVDETSGEGIPGVNIIVQGTSVGTVTDFTGEYNINVPDGSEVLVFSYIGYRSEEVSIGGRSTIDISMEPDLVNLQEVVVTAMGVEREAKSLAYAQQSVNTEALDEARSTNFINSLSGRAAGVQVVNSGTPNGTNRVVVRGITSVTGTNAPLYVVDGVPLDNQQGDAGVSVWNSGDDIDYGSPISNINPDDIASIEVLKGPNAAALYGSRASNGVVLITTKKGTTKKGLGVSINSNTSFVSIREFPYYQYVYGTGASGRTVRNANHLDDELGLPIIPSNNRRSYGSPMLGQDVITYNGEVMPFLPQPNNVKDLYQTGITYTNGISLEKATENGSFRLSYTNVTSEHTIDNFEQLSRHNLTFRGSQDISDRFTTDVSILYTNRSVDNRLYQNGSNRNPANNYMYIQADMSKENLIPYKDESGQAFRYTGPFNNPYWNLNENTNEDQTNQIIGNVTLTWKILEDLNLRGRVLGDVNSSTGEEFNNYGAPFDVDGYYRTFDRLSQNWNYEAVLTYDKTFSDLFSVNALVGANRFDLRRSSRDNRINSLLVPNVKSLSNSSTIPIVNESDFEKRINSVFSSLSLGYSGTIFVDLTARNDWSSTLPSDNNSYFYPSVGTSFVFSELIPSNNFLSFGKIRASYAEVGNDTDPYNVLTTYGFGGIYNNTAWLSLQNTRNNPDLKPELTSSWEFGLETGFFSNRLTLNATYYNSSTINQIIPAQTSPTTGFNQQIFNAGEIENKGWEVFLSGTPYQGNGFKWNVDVNWSTNESLVVSLIDGVDRLGLRSWFNVNVWAEVGKPLGQITGRVWARDPETGIPLVRNNGRVQREDDMPIGNAQPDWIGGIRNSFTYKGFSFNFLLDMKMGGDLYSGTMLKALNFGMRGETFEGRDDWYFSDIILGENNNERRGEGLFGNAYNDSERPKGATYEDVAFATRDEEGNWVAERDAEGNIVMANVWMNPQLKFFDPIDRQETITYDASYIKLREVVFGYNFPTNLLSATPFTQARLSLVGRNLWIIHRNTPQGVDPEGSTTSGNGQGIEYATFLPTRQIGVNVKLSF